MASFKILRASPNLGANVELQDVADTLIFLEFIGIAGLVPCTVETEDQCFLIRVSHLALAPFSALCLIIVS